MSRKQSKALNSENQLISSYKQIKPIDLNLTQSSALRPQSSNLGSHDFEQICTELLCEGHRVKFRAPGDSMYPTICDGDVVTVRPIKITSIAVGDIILYRHKSGVAAHRVMRTLKQSQEELRSAPQGSQNCSAGGTLRFFLRGDAAAVFDDPVSAEQILGKVTLVERQGRCIDPYSRSATIRYKARRLAARLRRIVFP